MKQPLPSTQITDRNLLQVLRDRYGTMSDTYKKIAEFIINNMETATFASLGELSKKIGVSDATLIRFARELGFKGFQDFRKTMVDYIRRIIYPSHKVKSSTDQADLPVLEKVWKMDIEFINHTMSEIDREWFKHVIDLITDARRIHTMGWGVSSFLAEFLAFQLERIGYDAVALTRERHPLIERMVHVKEGDILIVFDFQFYSHEIVEAVEYMKSYVKGVRLITVTSDASAQIVQYADYSFFSTFWAVVGQSESLMGSLSAPMCLINAICEAVSAQDPEKATASLENIERTVMNNMEHTFQFGKKRKKKKK
ncbi:MAG: MurR/RpiR family transcriptional regulator [Deltaproteobacteria bacterium]|nr:MurR/RpiR family transcriptional regulator [Deltaproteobacteria bacterium]